MLSVFSPEVQRIVLMVALAAISYLLLLAWNEDYGAGADDPPAAEERPAEVAETGAEPVPSDVPDESLAGAAEVPGALGAEAATEPSAPSRASRLVRVSTPVLELTIDRLGGDVVDLRLPRYPRTIDSGVPFQLLTQDGGHVYVAQSGLIGADGPDAAGERPLYRAPRSEYRLDEGTLEVELNHETPAGVRVVKRFRFGDDAYDIDVEHEVYNGSARAFRGRVFTQLKRDATVPEEEGFQMGPRPYLGAALTTPESRYEKVDFEDLDDGDYRVDVTGGWIAVLQHYFVVAWVGNPDELNAYNGRRLSSLGSGLYAVGYVAPEFEAAPGETVVATARLYAGPKDQDRLEAIASNLNLTVDYGIFWWLAVPLFQGLALIQSFVGNWGVAIVLLTLLIKLVLYPLSAVTYRSGAKMRRVAPQLKRLQERYSDDRRKLSEEMMALYRREGANPLGGCLPMLVQMPVFFALYWVLYESVELRQAPFFFWIDDLAAIDPFFVLPILMGGSMYLMQLLNPPMPDPMQARMMKMMPFIFTAFSLFFPSGLVLYWLCNNLLSLAQQWFVTRQADRAAAAKGS